MMRQIQEFIIPMSFLIQYENNRQIQNNEGLNIKYLIPQMGSGKPRGMRAGRKLKTKRRLQRWNDKEYNARLLCSRFKNPLLGSCMAKGLVVEKIGVESKQPNSAIRKGVRVALTKTKKKITAFVPWDGSLNYITENDEVTIAGFGKKGKSKGDIPGIRFKVIAIKGISLLALWTGKKQKK